MTEEERGKVEVEVGRWTPDGTFTGETLRFTAEEVGSYTDRSLADSEDDRGITYTLYRTPDARYRVHVKEWTRWQGEDSSAALHPFEERGEGGEDATETSPRPVPDEREAAVDQMERFGAKVRRLPVERNRESES